MVAALRQRSGPAPATILASFISDTRAMVAEWYTRATQNRVPVRD